MSNQSPKMSFSAKQNEALSLIKQNMLVSAGAGSGKTAVLVERLVRIITDANVPLERVLVLTFTKAGAQEFKTRIKDKLLALPEHSSKAFALDNADITTFDAFALSILKKYGYLNNTNANVINLDENVEKVLLKRLFDEVMLEEYLKPSPQLKAFADRFLKRDDTKLFDLIISFHRSMSLTINPQQFTNEYLETFYNDDVFEKYYEEFNRSILIILRETAALIKTLSNEKLADSYDVFLNNYMRVYTFDDFMENRKCFDKQRKPNGSDANFPEDISKVKAIVNRCDKLKTYYPLESKSKMYDNFIADKMLAQFVINIYQKIIIRLNIYKKERNAFTFGDIARNAYELVSLPQVREELRQQYEYILIDEYQDTSDIQEAFTDLFANNNVYMVGDIKQSIYGFRNANPDIFREKYASYANNNGGVLVDLNDNYRSRPQVLSAINDLLSDIMTDSIGGANYIKDHIIGYGNKMYDTFVEPDQEAGLRVLNYDKPSPKKNPDDPLSKFSNPEIEAFIVIKDIKDKIEKGFMVYDDKIRSMRKAEYRDFTILISRRTHFKTIEKQFGIAGIPLHSDVESLGHDDKVKIGVISLLKIFIGYSQFNMPSSNDFRMATASFLRSFIVEYSDQKLLDLMGNGNSDFSNDPMLMKIKNIATIYRTLPVMEIVNKLIDEFKVFDKLYRLGNIIQNTIKLKDILSDIESYTNLNFDLIAIVDLIKESKEIDTKIKVSKPKLVENSVNLMTIHNSKGLEFPIVYYIDLAQSFYQNDKAVKLKATNSYGLIMPQSGGHLSVNGHLYEQQMVKSTLSEKIRLLYVALTRARELMIVIQPKIEDDKVPDLIDSKRFYDVLLNAKVFQNAIEIVDVIPLIPNKTIDLPSDKKRDIIVFTLPEMTKNTLVVPQKTELLKVNETLLKLGTRLHKYVEMYDFTTKKLDYIANKDDRAHIKALLDLGIFASCRNDNVYTEYNYFDEDLQKTFSIDFFVLGARKITLIDFKLVNISSEEYTLQVQRYARHLKKVFNKEVEAFIVSIINRDYREVNVRE